MEPKSKRVRLDTAHPDWIVEFVNLLATIDGKDWQSAVELKNVLMCDPVIASLVGHAKLYVHDRVSQAGKACGYHTSLAHVADIGYTPSSSTHMTLPQIGNGVRPMMQ